MQLQVNPNTTSIIYSYTVTVAILRRTIYSKIHLILLLNRLSLTILRYIDYMIKKRLKRYDYGHRNRRGRDHIVVGFTTSYAISVYHH